MKLELEVNKRSLPVVIHALRDKAAEFALHTEKEKAKFSPAPVSGRMVEILAAWERHRSALLGLVRQIEAKL